jgi:hypothetical protein
MGPTFVAIALGMLINLGLYESMIAEALHTGIVFYLSGLLSLLAGLAIDNLHNTWCADWRVFVTGSRLANDDQWHHPHCRAADRGYNRFEHLWRSRQHDRSRADHWRAWRFFSASRAMCGARSRGKP